MNFLNNYIYYIGAFGLIFIGLYIILVKHNLIKVIIGFSILNTGINLFLIAIGYVENGAAPIFSREDIDAARMVDPVPQALVLTAIVIGVAILNIFILLHHLTILYFSPLPCSISRLFTSPFSLTISFSRPTAILVNRLSSPILRSKSCSVFLRFVIL